MPNSRHSVSMTMRKIATTLLALTLCVAAFPQNAETLYKEGKALYDAKNYQQAFPKLKAAAEKGHKKAQYRVGLSYDKGRGVAEDDAMAVKWYEKSAKQGYAKAQYELAKCYVKGEGVAKDEAKAKSWLKKAVKNEKHGQEIKEKIKQDAKDGKESAKIMLTMLK